MKTSIIKNNMKEFLKRIKNYISPEPEDPKNDPQFPLMGYMDKESQEVCFNELIKSINIQTNDSIADIGCGFGDMYPYLTKYDYTGIDLNSIAIEKCKSRFPSAEFKEMDLASLQSKHDWIVSSNLFITPYPMDMMVYISKCVSIMYEQSNKGVAFNMFSSYGEVQHGYHHYDPIEIFSRMVSQYRTVDLIHSYSKNNFIISIKKNI